MLRTGSSARRSVLAFASGLLLLAACGGDSARDMLTGTWGGELPAGEVVVSFHEDRSGTVSIRSELGQVADVSHKWSAERTRGLYRVRLVSSKDSSKGEFRLLAKPLGERKLSTAMAFTDRNTGDWPSSLAAADTLEDWHRTVLTHH